MNPETAYEHVRKSRIVAIFRGDFASDTVIEIARALMQQNFTAFELTMNSYQPLETMQALKAALGDEAAVGMGTILDTEAAQQALDSGADFVVSPAFQPAVVERVQSADVMFIPGVITATEAVSAWEMGVSVLKLFPIGPLGLDYFKAISGPLDHMKFMCNGAINEANAHEFLNAGALACGIGSWLTGKGNMSLELIERRAAVLRLIIDDLHGDTKPTRLKFT
jgi:2-dehydro-3-deoxyphosphogluconate aldolase/(4S)-4-hydroxy-2-oxoglutarate aldolase